MRFVPSFELKLINENDYENEISKITEEICKIRGSGKFSAFDNTEIYYEYFLAENCKGSIVIVHGLSEFINKFYEFIYYSLNQGYNVFIYDQRCHGLSGRLTDQLDLLHVDRFNDYVKDLSQFVETVVKKIADEPIFLYSQSMGGAECALYLAEHSDNIKKAVLAVPMFQPVVDVVPYRIARAGVGFARHFYGNKTKFLLSKEFNPDIKYNESQGTSRARFEHNMKMRIENPNYRSTPMSFGWTHNSLIVRKSIFKSKNIKGIKTPILLLTAKKDRVVESKPHYKFAEKCKVCKLVELENANHALLASDNQTLKQVLEIIYGFYAD
jgi:lysophospholipase